MPSKRVLLPLIAVTVAISACSTPISQTPTAEKAQRAVKIGSISGSVAAPAGIIGMDGASIIGMDGASIIGMDGASLQGVSPDRRLMALTENPLANTTVYLADATGKAVSPRVTSKTDASGKFTLTPVPVGRFQVVATATSNGKVALLRGLSAVATGLSTVSLSTASTLVSAAVTEGRTDDLTLFSTDTYGRAVGLCNRSLADAEAPNLADAKAVLAAINALAAKDAELANLLADLRGEKEVKTPAPETQATAAPTASATPFSKPTATPEPARRNPPINIFVADSVQGIAYFVAPAGAGSATKPTLLTISGGDAENGRIAPFTNLDVITGESLYPFSGIEAATGSLKAARGLAVSADGTQAYLAGSGSHNIWQLSLADRAFTLLAGKGTLGADNGAAKEATFNAPEAVAVTGNGDSAKVYVADTGNNAIRLIEGAHVSTVIAAGTLKAPAGLAIGEHLYVADTGNHCIRRFKLDGTPEAFVAGQPGQSGMKDGASADKPTFNAPTGLALDTRAGQQALYVADTGNKAIRRIDLATGAVSTVLSNIDATGDLLYKPVALTFAFKEGWKVPRIYVSDPGAGTGQVVFFDVE